VESTTRSTPGSGRPVDASPSFGFRQNVRRIAKLSRIAAPAP
jgi:hypothetical protein